MNRLDWLSTIDEGDFVVVETGNNSMYVARVNRVTPSRMFVVQIIDAKSELKFRKDGYQVGSAGFHFTRLVEYTREVRDELERKRIVKRFKQFQFEALTLDDLKKINHLLNTVIQSSNYLEKD